MAAARARVADALPRLAVPLVSTATLAATVAGPLAAPRVHAACCTAFFAAMLALACAHAIKYAVAARRIVASAASAADASKATPPCSHVHAIIVPNYCEPASLLHQTLHTLAAQPWARAHYVVVLAMEAAEPQSAAKCAALRDAFRHAFHAIVASTHRLAPGEARGKGSNVACAARALSAWCAARGISADRVLVTVTDADAGLPFAYFASVEQQHAAAAAKWHIYSPPMLFARNTHQVPALVRAADVGWSVAHTQNLLSSFCFPCSTYTLPLDLAEHVGGWDAHADAIGEDMHMSLKCFYRAGARAVPVYVPIILCNVHASSSWATVLARFAQARRHLAGCVDSWYALRHTRPTRAHLVCLMHVLEAHFVPATAWLTVLAVPVCAFLAPEVLAAHPLFQQLGRLLIVPYAAMVLIYKWMHWSLAALGAARPPRWWHIFDFGLLPVCALAFAALPAASHATNAVRLVLRRPARVYEYVVAPKPADDVCVTVRLQIDVMRPSHGLTGASGSHTRVDSAYFEDIDAEERLRARRHSPPLDDPVGDELV